jgi:translation machinery-associated protein 16
MAPSKKPSTKNTSSDSKKQKKEKLFHPQSRKAGQLVRSHIRKSKLEDLAQKRSHKRLSQGARIFRLRAFCLVSGFLTWGCGVVFLVDVLGFFYSTLPPEGELSLDELHLIVRDIWLARHDKDLEQERAKRRKGRPKSVKEIQIEELNVREAEEYRTGLGSSPFVVNFFFFFCGTPMQTTIFPHYARGP